MKCPDCDSSVEALVTAENNYLTYISTLFLALVLGYWCVFFLPFTIPLTRSIALRCPRCDQIINKKNPIGIKCLGDQVMTIQLGKFAIVFSRQYLLGGLVLSCCLYSLFFTSSEHSFTISGLTWDEFIEDCSAENIIKNKELVQQTFYFKYYGQIIAWEGFLMKAQINEGWFQGEHAATLLVKMHPSESEIYADLLLTLSREDFLETKAVIVTLDRGDKFAFNATLIAVGDEETIHHLHAHQLRKMDGNIDIPYEMRNRNRNSAYKPSVEILSIVDKPVTVDHDHIHLYNDTYNSTMD